MTQEIIPLIDQLLGALSPYTHTKSEKRAILDHGLRLLDAHHYQACDDYSRICQRMDPGLIPPYLPVQLFKTAKLKSVPDDQIIKTLTSSGTTSQVVSKIYLDRLTSQYQTKVLVKIMQTYLGRARLPMLIIDNPSVIKDRYSFSARGAGILGLSTFGRNHTYALNDDMSIDMDTVLQFAQSHHNQPIFIFGFTFMVWQYFVQAMKDRSIDGFQNAILIHSGGWKKLIDYAVDNAVFKAQIFNVLGVSKIHNFYGMVEQIGSIFVECEEGVLHAPTYADIKAMDLTTLSEVPFGTPGIIALESLLPLSYPGHRLLTEDVGIILGEDDCPCGKQGRYFQINGRLKTAEIRGCSDTHSEETR